MRRIKLHSILAILLAILSIQVSFAQGSRYSGTYKKASPVTHVRTNNLVFEGLEFDNNNDVRCIELYDCENVTIRNCKFKSPKHQAIYIYGCKNVIVEDCTFENVNFALKASTSQGVRFEHNDVLNITGYMYTNNSDLFGGVVQTINVTGSGNSISYNAIENIPGQCDLEDVFNTFGNSSGTANSPFMIKGNWIRGGGTTNSGTGIVIGDYGGSYTTVEDNILVNSCQVALGVAGGQNMTLRNNLVYHKQLPNSNVGLVAYNWTPAQNGKFQNVVVQNNRLNFTSKNGQIGTYWIPTSEGIIGVETNVYDKNITASILPDKIIGRALVNNPTNPDEGTTNPGGGVTPEPEKPEVTPPTGGGGSTEEPGKGPETNPDNGVVDTSITIYLDKYNRICVNSKDRVLRTSNVSVFNQSGTKLYSQPLVGYHTVLLKRFSRGTYDVKVKNGNKQQNQQLIIK